MSRASIITFTAFAAASVAATTASAQFVNVALGREATVVAGSVNGSALSTLTDGAFLSRGTLWQENTVWWNGLEPTIEIDLGAQYNLGAAIVQADDNDAYRLLYWNADSNSWDVLWDVPNFDEFGSGMQTRPNPEDDTAVFMFDAPVLTNKIRFVTISGDTSYSVSEIQVFTIPAPGIAAATLTAGLLASRRRR